LASVILTPLSEHLQEEGEKTELEVRVARLVNTLNHETMNIPEP
jgi:hypothetical protein